MSAKPLDGKTLVDRLLARQKIVSLHASEPPNGAGPNGAGGEGVTQAGRARLYNLHAFDPEAEAAAIPWQIEEWQVQGQIHLTVAEEKRGKSTQAWRRIQATSRGGRYLDRYPARQGRVLIATEMDSATIQQLLLDDDIEPDWEQVRTMFLDDYPPGERLRAIQDACKHWQPIVLALDPIDECLGLDEKGIFNPATTSSGFDLLRSLARAGIAIDGLYHYNNAGTIANSYKFRSKPDHIFQLRGADPSDLTVQYTGRLRAIPRKRRVTGNGQDGYEVTTLEAAPTGRPARTQQMVIDCLRQAGVPLSPLEVSRRTGLGYDAARKALARAESGPVVESRGLYSLRQPGSES